MDISAREVSEMFMKGEFYYEDSTYRQSTCSNRTILPGYHPWRYTLHIGQIPVDPATGEVVGTTIEEQADRVMKNLGAVLEAAGSSYENAIKTVCFLADMNDFAAFNEVYAKYFVNKPARSCVAVKTLPKNVLCEVEVIAAIG